jgi:GxxExxY protein
MLIDKNKIIYPELSYQINGILFKVRKQLGIYCSEKQYCDAIEAELKLANLEYEREKILDASFPDEKPGRNRIDFKVGNKIILEVKAKSFVTKDDYFQTQRYLGATGLKLAILANMRRYAVNPKRILNSEAVHPVSHDSHTL